VTIMRSILATLHTHPVLWIGGLSVVLLTYWTGRHYGSSISCSKVVQSDGQECDRYSFNAWRANTLIGHTVGRVYIALASARYERRESKREKHETKATADASILASKVIERAREN
jgi:hypothetical protein